MDCLTTNRSLVEAFGAEPRWISDGDEPSTRDSKPRSTTIGPRLAPEAVSQRRVMLVEQDRQRAERFRDCMQDSRVSMQLQVVSSDLDALDLLTIQAEFNRNELPDILVLGTGASMKNGSYNIMRFIHDEAQFAGMQVVAFTEALSC